MNNFPPTTEDIPVNPKIKICLSGLGILVINGHGVAESGYLTLPSHATMISIWRNDCERVITNEVMGNNILEILSPNQGNCVCFLKENDPRNYTHMIDLNEIYPGSNLDTSKSFQSKLFINDAVFFTEPDSRFDVEKYVEGTPGSEVDMPLIGSGLWGYSRNENATFTFKGQTYGTEPGETFTIRILSSCNADNADDFKYYYEYLTGAGSDKFNLRRKGTSNSWKIDCEKRVKEELQEQINEFLSDDSGKRFSKPNMDDIKNDLDWLNDIKCAPEPCLKVTFLDKPRSLP